MDHAAEFFDYLRDGLMGPKLEDNEVSGCNAILGAMAGLPISYCAYALATAWHETAAKMQPVREAFWLSEAWRKKNLRYWPWYGRGYVQLTWEENYDRADSELGLNGTMLTNPDRAMEPEIAAKIMRVGMLEGWFAGDRHGRHTLARHLPEIGNATEAQFKSARRMINGTDRDLQIARYANSFQKALSLGGW
jgi:putative chitinase